MKPTVATRRHSTVPFLELSNGQLYGWLTSAVDYFAVQQATFGLRADGPTGRRGGATSISPQAKSTVTVPRPVSVALTC